MPFGSDQARPGGREADRVTDHDDEPLFNLTLFEMFYDVAKSSNFTILLSTLEQAIQSLNAIEGNDIRSCSSAMIWTLFESLSEVYSNVDQTCPGKVAHWLFQWSSKCYRHAM